MPGVILMLFLALVGGVRDDKWEKTFSIHGRADLRIKTSDANIKTSSWEKNEIMIRVVAKDRKIGEGGVKITDSQSGDIVELSVSLPRIDFHMGLHRRPVNVEVFLPRLAKLNLETGDGKIDVTGNEGEMVLKAGDGDINVQAISGRLAAMTGDGSVRGDGRFDHLNIRTGDGRVELEAQPGSTVSSPWWVHTGDGSLTLRLPSALDADVKVRTRDGHIDLQIPVAISGRPGNKQVEGRINKGGGLISVESGDGSIRLEHSN